MALGIGVDISANTVKLVEGVNKAAGSLSKLEGIAKTAGAAIMSHLSINAVKALADMGAKALQIETAFKNATRNMSIDAEKWVSALRAATKGTVDESDLMQKAMKGITQGISPDNITRMAEIASTVAIRKGLDVKDAYEAIIDAIETMRTRNLVSLGLITKAQAEMADEAKSAGVQVDMLRIILENTSNQQALIGALDETALAFQRAKAASKDFMESIGKEVAKVIGDLYDMANIIKNLFSEEGRAENKKRAEGVLSKLAMNETYYPSPGTPTLSSPYADSLKGAKDRKKASDEAAKHAEQIKKVVDNLNFEFAQLQRTDEEQKIYNALKQASIDINTKDGQTIANLASQYYKLEKSLKETDELREFMAKDEEQANADSLADFIKTLDAKKQANQNFAEEYIKTTQGEFALEREQLNKQYEDYLKYVENKDKLNEWYANRKNEIDVKEFENYVQTLEQGIRKLEDIQRKKEEAWEKEHEVMNSLRDAWGLTYDEIYTGAVNTWTEVADVITSASEQMSQTLSSVMVGFINGTVDARKAVQDLANSILQSVIQALIKVAVQQVLMATIGDTIRATSTAKTLAEMQQIYAAASAAASALSMATWGASAATGSAVYMGALGASIGFSQSIGAGMFGSPEGMAQGGVINEHIIGRGLQTGKYYELGEEGPERVTPLRGQSKSNITININGAVLNNYDELARVLVPAIRKAEYDGV